MTLWLTIALMSAAPAGPPTSGPAGASTWQLRTVDGVEATGVVASWDLPGGLSFRTAAGDVREIAMRDVDTLTRISPSADEPRGEWRATLSDGTTLPCEIIGGDQQSIVLRHARLESIRAPLELLATLDRRANAVRLPPASADEDFFALTAGDEVRGAVVAVDAEGLSVLVGDVEQPVRWDAIAGVVMARGPAKAPPALDVLVTLSDDSILAADELSWRPERLRIRMPAGPRLDVDLGEIVEIEVRGGRRVWLGDLPPSSYEAAPYFDKTWPLRVDANALGGQLRMAGRAYRRGVGLHSACRATWDLDGRYARFTALAGIDDSAGRHADADLTILVDGEVRTRLDHLRSGEPPRPVDIDLRGARRLTIEVGFGARGPVQDRVNLARAALVLPP